VDTPADLLADKYGKNDLSRNGAFIGGYINFGYWQHVDPGNDLTAAARIRSQQDLYRVVIAKLQMKARAQILEIGCGRGLGSALTLVEHDPAKVYGIDLYEEQIRRARRENKNILETAIDRLGYQVGSATAIPFSDGQFDHMISVEVLQHVKRADFFAGEARRVLKPGATMSVATFFINDDEHRDELATLLPTISDGTDNAHHISTFVGQLKDAGFSTVASESIGENVWLGWDKWLSQTEFHDKWPRKFLRAYQRKLIDYYIVTAS
jgi:cyclopropane fatty-acyl-phospholipid synthase-like methyltransferase